VQRITTTTTTTTLPLRPVKQRGSDGPAPQLAPAHVVEMMKKTNPNQQRREMASRAADEQLTENPPLHRSVKAKKKMREKETGQRLIEKETTGRP